jgi:hypothetical protein
MERERTNWYQLKAGKESFLPTYAHLAYTHFFHSRSFSHLTALHSRGFYYMLLNSYLYKILRLFCAMKEKNLNNVRNFSLADIALLVNYAAIHIEQLEN